MLKLIRTRKLKAKVKKEIEQQELKSAGEALQRRMTEMLNRTPEDRRAA